MIVFKEVDQYSKMTGNWEGTSKVYDHTICDYTGKRIRDGNPNSYFIDFNDNDPNFGDGEGEGWLYEYENERGEGHGYHHYELFGQKEYNFFLAEDGYTECFQTMMEDAIQHIEIYSLDHLLRWSRGKMLERVIKSGEYKLEQFLQD